MLATSIFSFSRNFFKLLLPQKRQKLSFWVKRLTIKDIFCLFGVVDIAGEVDEEEASDPGLGFSNVALDMFSLGNRHCPYCNGCRCRGSSCYCTKRGGKFETFPSTLLLSMMLFLTLFQTTNIRLIQTERVCRRQF